MPRRTDLRKILVLGAGPIVIGQACEFDYSGTQGCKALREEGYEVVLVNSNPATIMTDPELADRTYIEPLVPEVLEAILERERPDALLPTLGGQTALNLAMELESRGILSRYGVELIGAKAETIERAEDRARFKEAMEGVGLDLPASETVTSWAEASQVLERIGLPLVVRPSFTLGGTGGGIAHTLEEARSLVEQGLAASPIGQVLVEEGLVGWKEFELEVMRDGRDNVVIVCTIENLDPLGVHTGDSWTVAPALTLPDHDYQLMRDAAIRAIRAIGVDTGGANVQFGVNPRTGRMVMIEINPRVSRSSALASKATGFPIARLAAKLAVGYHLDELRNDITGTTACFEPTIDYVVTKAPRFDFEKFGDPVGLLGTSMRAVGEVMAIGRTFKESLQKAIVSLEIGATGLLHGPSDDLETRLARPTATRLFAMGRALESGMSVEEIARRHGVRAVPVDLNDFRHELDLLKDLRAGSCVGLVSISPGILRAAEVILHSMRGNELLLMTANPDVSSRLLALLRAASHVLCDRPSLPLVEQSLRQNRSQLMRLPQVHCAESYLGNATIDLLRKEIGLLTA